MKTLALEKNLLLILLNRPTSTAIETCGSEQKSFNVSQPWAVLLLLWLVDCISQLLFERTDNSHMYLVYTGRLYRVREAGRSFQLWVIWWHIEYQSPISWFDLTGIQKKTYFTFGDKKNAHLSMRIYVDSAGISKYGSPDSNCFFSCQIEKVIHSKICFNQKKIGPLSIAYFFLIIKIR